MATAAEAAKAPVRPVAMKERSISTSTYVTARTEPPSRQDTLDDFNPDTDLAKNVNVLTIVDGIPVSKSVWPASYNSPNSTAVGSGAGALPPTNGAASPPNTRIVSPTPAVAAANNVHASVSSVPSFVTGSRISHVSMGSNASSEATVIPQTAVPQTAVPMVVATSPENSPPQANGVVGLPITDRPATGGSGGPLPPRRPELRSRPSRSYTSSPQLIETHYDRPLEDPVDRRASIVSSRKSSKSKLKKNSGAVAAGTGAVVGGGTVAALNQSQKGLSRSSSSTSRRSALVEMLPEKFARRSDSPVPNGDTAASVVSPESDLKELDEYGNHPATRSELERRHSQRQHSKAVAGAAGAATATMVYSTAHSGGELDPIQRPHSAHAAVNRRSSDMERTEDEHHSTHRRRPQSAAAGTFGRRDSRDRLSQATTLPDPSQYGRDQPLSPHGVTPQRRLPPITDDGETYDNAGAAGVGAGVAGVGAGVAGGLAVGEVATLSRQHAMQSNGERGHRLVDHGPVTVGRHSSFGYRPRPVSYDDYGHGFAAENRSAMVDRSNTVPSRATTLGRNGTLRRGANGGTIGRRPGAFGQGAGLSVGTQPEEILGRDDIHLRAELAEREMDPRTLKKLTGTEKREAKRLSKMMAAEGRSQAKSVDATIKDLKALTVLQRDAIGAERKSQQQLGKWTAREHKARMRFLKERERYEKVEGKLKGAEDDFEERRHHAAGLTAQVAEKTQELDDMRAQKAADDREREVKIANLKYPAHS